MKTKEEKPKQKFVVQRMLGVEADTPEQAVEMTTVKTSGVTSLSINVQPSTVAPVAQPSAGPTGAMEKMERSRAPLHAKP
jgi:hypothetical protein